MNASNLITKCPKCGKPLQEREGKYGKFLGCSGYPECTYTEDLSELSNILCPICDNKLNIRVGKFNKYLSCSGYPDCNFNFYPDNINQEFVLSCPSCKKDLQVSQGGFGLVIECSGCHYSLNLNREDRIPCPYCSRPLAVRKGTYGKFLGCTGYPDCKFIHNLRKSSWEYLFCPKCHNELTISSSKGARFFKCESCNFKYYI